MICSVIYYNSYSENGKNDELYDGFLSFDIDYIIVYSMINGLGEDTSWPRIHGELVPPFKTVLQITNEKQ